MLLAGIGRSVRGALPTLRSPIVTFDVFPGCSSAVVQVGPLPGRIGSCSGSVSNA